MRVLHNPPDEPDPDAYEDVSEKLELLPDCEPIANVK
jgi:hypothetical protein